MFKKLSLIASLLGFATLASAGDHHHGVKGKIHNHSSAQKFFGIPSDGQPMFQVPSNLLFNMTWYEINPLTGGFWKTRNDSLAFSSDLNLFWYTSSTVTPPVNTRIRMDYIAQDLTGEIQNTVTYDLQCPSYDFNEYLALYPNTQAAINSIFSNTTYIGTKSTAQWETETPR